MGEHSRNFSQAEQANPNIGLMSIKWRLSLVSFANVVLAAELGVGDTLWVFFLGNSHQVPWDMMFLFFLTLTTRIFGVMICLDVFFVGSEICVECWC